MNLKDIIGHLEKHCGDEDSYTIVFKEESWPMVRDKLRGKLTDMKDVAGVFIKGTYKGHEISIFPTGRVIISGVKDDDTLIAILSEILSSPS